MATLVIGIGSTLRGDDGAGVQAAGQVASRLADVDCLTVHQLTPELADTIRTYDRVYFIDASVAVTAVTVSRLERSPAVSGTHTAAPGGLLTLAHDFYGQCPSTAVLIEIPAAQFEYGEQLGPEALVGVEAAVARVVDLERATVAFPD